MPFSEPGRWRGRCCCCLLLWHRCWGRGCGTLLGLWGLRAAASLCLQPQQSRECSQTPMKRGAGILQLSPLGTSRLCAHGDPALAHGNTSLPEPGPCPAWRAEGFPQFIAGFVTIIVFNLQYVAVVERKPFAMAGEGGRSLPVCPVCCCLIWVLQCLTPGRVMFGVCVPQWGGGCSLSPSVAPAWCWHCHQPGDARIGVLALPLQEELPWACTRGVLCPWSTL